ncbi:type II secretion system protein N [Gilvimarinus xylanilyticus]|uniref:Type II secretion system protein N n=1 Tax=Gilvimarinus xylanilyticus TaxID=2944139 RepID=A0A9X2I5L7_9GAMM|nr:type II secretion system protein N [Gilvimarinus xylanilyticus]MCP8900351.1 type II secretion system protein N [Gilvimarinus xylanilyticus]
MIRWILFGLVCTLVFAVTQIPATWGAHFMTQGTGLGLSGISGSLWRGKAGMASVRIDGRDYSLGELTWHLQPMSLLTLKPCADLTTSLERQQVTGTACASTSGALQLSDTNISIPASLIQDLPEPTKLNGQVSAHIDTLKLEGQTLNALKGNLSWTGARLHNGQSWLDLGAFAGDLSATDEGHIRADIFSLEGPVDLSGNVVMPLSGGVIIDTTFKFTDDFAREVQADQWLPMLAEPLDDGRSRLRMSL